jgi:predicted ABC-class ATPase
VLRRFRRRPRLDIQSKARLRMDLTAARHDLARTEAALDAANDTIRSLGNALNKRPTAEQLAVAEQRATSHLLELHRVRALLQVEQYDSATTVEQLAALVDRWENLATAGTFGHAARELRQVLTP